MNGLLLPDVQYACDGCRCECNLLRYHCEECSDFDYCPQCYYTRGESCAEGHRFFSRQEDSFTQIRSAMLRVAGGVGYQLVTSLRRWPDRPCIGVRDHDSPPGYEGQDGVGYRFIRYRELHREALLLLRGMHDMLVSMFPDEEDTASLLYHVDPIDREPMRIAIYLKNSVQWVVADVALALGGFTSVPLDPGATPDTLKHILSITDTRVVITTSDLLCSDAFQALSRADLPALKFVVSLDKLNCHPSQLRFPSVTATEMCMTHVNRPMQLDTDSEEVESDDLLMPMRGRLHVFTLLFTSGSTGKPKGAIQTHSIWSYGTFEVVLMKQPLVSVVYRPLCYATDRELLWRALANGGRVGMFQGEISTLFDDVPLIKPQTFSAPPRVWSFLYDRFQSELKDRLKTVTDEEMKLRVRRELLEEYNKLVGPRCSSVGTGGASIRPEVFQWLKECFSGIGDHRVYESYGTTENGGIAVNGAIPAETKVMLIDVPEMGFLTSSDPPCGEICVITPDGIPGYWKDEENTAALFHVDDKGVRWHRTGDIGEMKSDGSLRVIDRRSNLVKLSNSVFISPDYLEAVFSTCISVREVFIYAESSWDYPLAVVTPAETLLTTPPAEATVLAEFRVAAAAQGVPVTHVPHGVIVSAEPFTAANKCLTISLKLSRPGLRAMFQAALRAKYAVLAGLGTTANEKSNSAAAEEADEVADEDEEGMQRQQSSVLFTSAGADSQGLATALSALYSQALGYSHVELTDSARSLNAGSLAIAGLKERIRRHTSVTVPIETLWNATIAEVAATVAAAQQSRGSFAAMALGSDPDGAKENVTVANDQHVIAKLEARLRTDTAYTSAASVTQQPPPEATTALEGRVIFLTGATGFIGSHVLHTILTKQPDVVKIYCLVRGKSHGPDPSTTLLDRLLEAAGADRDLLVASAASQRLEAVHGDLATRQLGLSPADAAMVSSQTTEVIHCGAAVNHVLPYDAIADANVGSVRALLELFSRNHGVTTRLTRFVLVSTVSAIALSETGSTAVESDPIKEVSAALIRRMEPSGYGLSKWAAERLLLNAIAADALPPSCGVAIVRCGMTSWATVTGVGNKTDWLSALAGAVATLGTAPRGRRPLNLVPVDWVADVIAFTRGRVPLRIRGQHGDAPATVPTLHLVNPTTFDFQPTLAALASSGEQHGQINEISDAEWIQLLCTAAGAPEGAGPSGRLQAAKMFFGAGLPSTEIGVKGRFTTEHLPSEAAFSDRRLITLGCTEPALYHAGYVDWVRSMWR
jgi:fatty acid CoA ligase FadD9